MWRFPLIPEQASSVARDVDAVFLSLIGLTALIILIVCALVIGLSVRYRRTSAHSRHIHRKPSVFVEIAWSIPLVVTALVIFVWAGRVYFQMRTVPDGASNIYVVGKQWMWQFEHADGRREINTLHVPVNEAIQLTMTSEDVIHSLYIPAFRVKMDVRPDTYSTMWFMPTQIGTYHLYCAEYCGTDHSRMRGTVVVMEPGDYQHWLESEPADSFSKPLMTGEDLFTSTGCVSCHQENGVVNAPLLDSIFGTTVSLERGSNVVVDEQYIRESIMEPNAKITAGYEPLMPTYVGRLSESQIARLIEYVKAQSASAETDTSLKSQTESE